MKKERKIAISENHPSLFYFAVTGLWETDTYWHDNFHLADALLKVSEFLTVRRDCAMDKVHPYLQYWGKPKDDPVHQQYVKVLVNGQTDDSCWSDEVSQKCPTFQRSALKPKFSDDEWGWSRLPRRDRLQLLMQSEGKSMFHEMQSNIVADCEEQLRREKVFGIRVQENICK